MSQAKKGTGLDSQEVTCRKYSEDKGYEVVDVLKDNCSGSVHYSERPAMQELIDMMETGAVDVIVFDSLSRLSRDTMFYLQFKKLCNKLGIKLESTTHKFDETPESHFVETIIASVSEFERLVNAKQVKRRMDARLMSGGCNNRPPRGYKAVRLPSAGRVLAPNEPEYSVIAKVMRRYLEDKDYSSIDAYYELVDSGVLFGDKNPKTDRARKILRNFVYTGYNVVKGKHYKAYHDGPVTVDEHYCIVEKLDNERKYPKNIKKNLEVYMWKGVLRCSECGKNLTGSPSISKGNTFHYYYCYNRQCGLKGLRSPFRAGEVDKSLVQQISSYKLPTGVDTDTLAEVLADTMSKGGYKKTEEELELEKEKEKIMERLLGGAVRNVIKAYEDKLNQIESRLETLKKERVVEGSVHTLRTKLATIYKLLINVDVVTNKGLNSYNKIASRALFDDNVIIDVNKCIRTSKKSVLFRVFDEFAKGVSLLVEMGGVAPPSNKVIDTRFFRLDT